MKIQHYRGNPGAMNLSIVSSTIACVLYSDLGCLLLEGHEVQVRDVDHVGAAHHRQHLVLHLTR